MRQRGAYCQGCALEIRSQRARPIGLIGLCERRPGFNGPADPFATRTSNPPNAARRLHVLRHLNAAGALSQSELAEGINVDAANLIEMLDELEGEGRIRREIDPHDPRRRRIILTPAGSRKLRAGLRAAEQADDDVLGTLEPQQLGSLRETILHAYRSSQPKPWGPGEEQGGRKRHRLDELFRSAFRSVARQPQPAPRGVRELIGSDLAGEGEAAPGSSGL